MKYISSNKEKLAPGPVTSSSLQRRETLRHLLPVVTGPALGLVDTDHRYAIAIVTEEVLDAAEVIGVIVIGHIVLAEAQEFAKRCSTGLAVIARVHQDVDEVFRVDPVDHHHHAQQRVALDEVARHGPLQLLFREERELLSAQDSLPIVLHLDHGLVAISDEYLADRAEVRLVEVDRDQAIRTDDWAERQEALSDVNMPVPDAWVGTLGRDDRRWVAIRIHDHGCLVVPRVTRGEA